MKRFRDLSIFLFFSLGITIIVIGSLFNYYLSPVNQNSVKKEIVITDGKDVDSIVEMLYDKKLIRNPKVFKLYMQINSVHEMKEGSFTIKTSMSSKEIVNYLAAGDK